MQNSRNLTALAKVLAGVTLICAIALPVFAALIFLFWNDLARYAAGNLHHVYDLTTLSTAARAAAFSLLLFGAIIQAYGLLGIRLTLLEAASGRGYSTRSLNGFKRFAWVAVAMVLVGIVQRTGLIAIFSASDPSHMGAISIQFGTDEAKSLFIGLLFVVVSYIFAEGKMAKDENDTFL